jgi:hypothetical protein
MLKKLAMGVGALALVAAASQAYAGSNATTHHVICHFDKSGSTVGVYKVVNGSAGNLGDDCPTNTGSSTGSLRHHLQKHNNPADYLCIKDYDTSGGGGKDLGACTTSCNTSFCDD